MNELFLNKTKSFPLSTTKQIVYIAILVLICFTALYFKSIFIAAAFLSLFTLIIILAYPEIALLILIWFVFSDIGTHIGSGLYIILLLFTFYMLLVSGFINHRYIVYTKVDLYCLLFFIISTVSIVFCKSYKLGFEALAELIKVYSLFFIIRNFRFNLGYYKAIFIIILMAALINALYGIYQFYNNPFIIQRVVGFKSDPNNLAILLVTGIPFVFPLFKEFKSKIIKIILIIIFSILFLGVAFSYSRGGMIALGVVLLFFLLNHRQHKWVILLFVLLCSIGIYIFIVKLAAYKSLIRLISADESFIQRLRVYKGGIKMFLAHPIIGVGFGNYIVWSRVYSNLTFHLYAHNIFLHIGAETGIFGLAIYGGIIVQSIRSVLRTKKRALKMKDMRTVSYCNALLWSLIGFLSAGMFLSQHLNKMLWCIMGLCISMENRSDAE